MGCFSCFSPRIDDSQEPQPDNGVDSSEGVEKETSLNCDNGGGRDSGSMKSFPFRDLAVATQNFNDSNLIGEGGFGKVFKGWLDHGQVVAIKQLNHGGLQGNKEFIVEVLMLILLKHPNLVSLVGYCAEGSERLLVYEYMPQGCLEDHLFDLPPGKAPLDWNMRIKIALGVAKGLAYLHDVASPPVIYRDMKAANILLDNDFNPKLSDFGLAKVGPVGDKTHVSTRVMGTYGYCAPDYLVSGKLTLKSDIYSFGVMLLEIITGRRVYDTSKTQAEQLLLWSRPMLSDKRKYARLADPALRRCYPPRAFYQLIVIVSMCLQERPHVRPIIGDVVVALAHVASQPYVQKSVPDTTNSPLRFSSPPERAQTLSRTPNYP